jgi:hypothetical protein
MKRTRLSRGASLVEGLIALAVLSAGTLGLTRLQAETRRSVELEVQREQALQLARHDLESWRAGLPADVAPPPYGIQRGGMDDTVAHGVAWTTVSVRWLDAASAPHRVVLASASSRLAPALSGALLLRRPDDGRVLGRAPAVPLLAHDRRDGSSLWRPAAALPLAFVVDNASARVVARCSGVDAADCTAIDGLLLSGWIRVSLAVPPDPVRPDDTPLPLAVALQLTQGALVAPGCITERRDGALAYHCIVAPEQGAWSGRSEVVADTTPEPVRVCRYVGAGGERNEDHPDRYDHVDRALMQQNFLVIRRDQPCPAVPPSTALPAGVATVPHPA